MLMINTVWLQHTTLNKHTWHNGNITMLFLKNELVLNSYAILSPSGVCKAVSQGSVSSRQLFYIYCDKIMPIW